MRVLLVDSETGWRGGQQQVLLLAQGLAKHPRFRGEAITVCRPGSHLADRLAAAGLMRAELEMSSPWSPRAICGLRRLARERSADMLHAHTSHAHNLSVLASIATSLHVVATRRVAFAPKGAWKYRRCARVVAISHAIAGLLHAACVAPDRIDVIPSGIDPARFTGADRTRGRQAFGIADDELAVVCIAALEGEKGIATLLASWNTLAPAYQRAHLILVGDGSLRGTLTAQAQSMPRVHFLGFRNDISDLLAAADIVTQPSLSEGLGTTVMDAMYAEKPVVASRAGGLPELIEDSVDGLLVSVGAAEPLAQALGRLLADDSLRVRLGTAAGATARRRFLASAMVDAYVDLYDRIMRGA